MCVLCVIDNAHPNKSCDFVEFDQICRNYDGFIME